MRTAIMAVGFLSLAMGLWATLLVFAYHRQVRAAAEYERTKAIEEPVN